LWNVIHGRAALIHEPNEVRILQVVRARGEISRIEIAKSVNLHKGTITDLVAKLIRAGFLEETGQVISSNRVGRRRILLRFRPLAGLVVGVDIGMTHAQVALTDLNAEILREEVFDYAVDAPSREVLKNVAAAITSLLAATKLKQSKLVGIGIGVQGVVDTGSNTLVLSHNKKGWEGESLSSHLEGQFHVPVYVENDVKTMTIGEYLLGAAKGVKDLVHIWVGDGLGAGIMINGHLLHGMTSSAGEVGYNGLESAATYAERFPLIYNNQVMFGDLLNDANLVESYRRNMRPPVSGPLSVATVAQKATAGDAIAREVIDEYVSLLSLVCINMVNILNPELILVGGKLAQTLPEVADMLQNRIHRDLLGPPAEAVRVRPAHHGKNGVVLGAAGLVLYELFEPLHNIPMRLSHEKLLARAKEVSQD
jgi:N-acetylglucosamine repressor